MPPLRSLPHSIALLNAALVFTVLSFLFLTRQSRLGLVTEFVQDALLGLDSDLSLHSDPQITDLGWAGAPWSSFAESTVFVQSTGSYHPSRPASFGKHVTDPEGLAGWLAPINHFEPPSADSHNRGCPPRSLLHNGSHASVPHHWVALIERGSCSFSDKVRQAASLGAIAVVVGNNEENSHFQDTLGVPGLVEMRSSGETLDINISSVFVSRNSYLDLLRLCDDASAQTSSSGAFVILSKDHLLEWELTDLLILLLFLPSMMTVFTILSHRIRLFQQQRQQRAPKDLVEAVPYVVWGEDFEKTSPAASQIDSDQSRINICASSGPSNDDEDLEAANSLPHSRMTTRLLLWLHRIRLKRKRAKSSEQPRINPTKIAPRPFSSITSSKLFTSQKDCAICLSDFVRGDFVRCLPCGHFLHVPCIDPWLLNTNRCCPVCRWPIDAEESSVLQALPSGEGEEYSRQAIVNERSPLLSRL